MDRLARDLEDFLSPIEVGLSLSQADARGVTRATLETLGEHIEPVKASQIAERLPPEMAPWIGTATPAESFDVDEFIRRVSQREEVDVTTAQRHATVVLSALARALPDKLWNDMVSELPRDFTGLLPRGPYIEVTSAPEFLARTARLAGLGEDEARRAVDAVLETLAERIAGGEVDDLVERLPVELHPPLRRGRERTGGQAQQMNLERFLKRVAEREGVNLTEAGLHARAVFRVLRETTGEEEFRDITVQLPEDYKLALAR